MTFDEQLQHSLGRLADHLRDEIARALPIARAEVAAHASEARDGAARDASAHARTEAEAIARVEIERLERRVQEISVAHASLEQRRAGDVAACERLLDGVRALDRATSLSAILDALVDCASREVARVGLLLARKGELRGWRFTGFGPAVDPARSVVVRAEESGIVGEAVRTGVAVSSDALSAPAFAELPRGRAALAVPVIVSSDVAAVLYADQGIGEEEERPSFTLRWPDALELFARHAARCLEAATAIKAVRVLTDPPEISESASSTALASAPVTVASADHGVAQPPDTREHVLRTSS